jgi:phosphatidate cytidylyltransferase
MIQTRLLIGTLLAILAAALLYADAFLAPWFPLVGLTTLAVLCRAAYELQQLLEPRTRPALILLFTGITLCWLANWWPVVVTTGCLPATLLMSAQVWGALLVAYCTAFVLAFLWEMARYPHDGPALPRLAAWTLITTYLGLLGSCFLQLRLLPESSAGPPVIAWLAAAIIVPKANDIAAYFSGTWMGRTPMAPYLSPKKTWEGALGGLAGGAIAAAALGWWQPELFPHGWPEALLFGLLVGAAGMLGDLAESLLKRDCHAKDAAAILPGFGGLLDLIDSLLFAAPVVYLWQLWRPMATGVFE